MTDDSTQNSSSSNLTIQLTQSSLELDVSQSGSLASMESLNQPLVQSVESMEAQSYQPSPDSSKAS